jgi:hypothetical protein
MKTGIAYFSCRDPRHVKNDVSDMEKKNCTYVIHTYSETDYNFYSLIMKDIVTMSHDAGLEVYINPWGVGRVFGGPEAFSQFVSENPGECQRMADGSPAPAACPNSRAFRDFMRAWIDSAVDTGADVVFWDEPHFHYTPDMMFGTPKPEDWACACDRCRELFRKQYGRDLPPVMDDDVVRFRDDTVVGLFTELTAHVREYGLKNAVCVLPEENPLFGISSWELLADIDHIDIFGTDPYWMLFNKPLEEYVRKSTKRVLDICRRTGKEDQMWVQAFLIFAGREKEIKTAIEIMAQEGATNIAAWSYLGGAFMNHKSQNHELVWDILGEAYGELRRMS